MESQKWQSVSPQHPWGVPFPETSEYHTHCKEGQLATYPHASYCTLSQGESLTNYLIKLSAGSLSLTTSPFHHSRSVKKHLLRKWDLFLNAAHFVPCPTLDQINSHTITNLGLKKNLHLTQNKLLKPQFKASMKYRETNNISANAISKKKRKQLAYRAWDPRYLWIESQPSLTKERKI